MPPLRRLMLIILPPISIFDAFDCRKRPEEKRTNDRFGDAIIEMITEIANGNEAGGGFGEKVV